MPKHLSGSTISLLALSLGLIGAGAASATPSVHIEHAVARVTIIPEARGDIQVSVVKANPRLPLRVTKTGDVVTVDGGLGLRSPNCFALFGRPGVVIWGIGRIGYDEMPQVVVRVPLDARVSATGAVFGEVNAGQNVDLANSGCGDWRVADQAGVLRLSLSGSGDVRGGSAAAAEIHLSGSGDANVQNLRGGLGVSISGSGDVTATSINGPLRAHVVGSGDVNVRGGAASDMDVEIAGSGDVSFGGVAQTLSARIAGSGDVSVKRVTGVVAKHIAGSGDVNVGR